MRIAKAQGDEDDLTLIYTADGQPCGVVSASKITPVTAAEIAKMQEAGVVIIDAGMGPVNAGGTTGLGLPRCPVSFRLRQSTSPRRELDQVPAAVAVSEYPVVVADRGARLHRRSPLAPF